MKITKRAAIISCTYIIAGFLVMGGFLIKTRSERDSLRLASSVNYSHAFSELSGNLGKLDTSLKKAAYSGTNAMLSAICTEGYAEALEAQAALGVLPYGDRELANTAAFLSKVGDYLYYLSRSAALGSGITDEERENLLSLEESASKISQVMSSLYADMLGGGVSVSELERAEAEVGEADDSVMGGLVSGIKELETEFPELPTLIYDGPFSEHITDSSPKRLDGKEEITGSEAIEKAAGFLGVDSAALKIEYDRDSVIPVYVVTRRNGTETVSVEVTKCGGEILYYGTTRAAGTPILSAEECVKAAETFLRKHGIYSMDVTFWEIESGDVVINFALNNGGVICYPDLIKVSVAMDTGNVSGYEAHGYISNNYKRDIPEPAISEDDARTKLSPILTEKSVRTAIIPTSGKDEVFCYEFLCETDDGEHCLVYINAETGAEEKILILLEDDNGTLTI